jgi:hypothetical protein
MDIPDLGKLTFGSESINLNYYLTAAYDDIAQASVELPAIIEWINEQSQPFIEERLRVKQLIKKTEAQVYFELIDGTFEQLYHGKKTAVAIERAISLDARVNDLYEKMARVQGWVTRLQQLQESLQAKLDLVRSVESTRRRVIDDGDNINN